AASLSHEITQPIASARNNARAALNFLKQQPPALGDVDEALACIVGDADRAGNIIERIRDQMKKAPPRKARFDLNEAIDEVVVLARSAIIRNDVSVQTRIAEGLFPVHGDRVQVQQYAKQYDQWREETVPEEGIAATDLMDRSFVTPSMRATAKY